MCFYTGIPVLHCIVLYYCTALYCIVLYCSEAIRIRRAAAALPPNNQQPGQTDFSLAGWVGVFATLVGRHKNKNMLPTDHHRPHYILTLTLHTPRSFSPHQLLAGSLRRESSRGAAACAFGLVYITVLSSLKPKRQEVSVIGVGTCEADVR